MSFSYFIIIDQNISNIKLSNVIRGNQLSFTSWPVNIIGSPGRAWCRLGTAGMHGVAQHGIEADLFPLLLLDQYRVCIGQYYSTTVVL